MRAAADRADIAIEVDSAGTGDWHVGQPPDRRAIATAARHGIDINGLRARKVETEDFHAFDHVVALDRSNLTALRALRPADARAQLSLLFDHVAGREGEDVADPYHGSDAGFEITWHDVNLGAEALLARLRAQPSG
ncbi:low molecular weight protein-tyrosine-phosphatase [Sphingomonas sp. Root710]|uniref:low molecular weight protein-tyrosine-phosphatase n=1 Tax=Sphingomonas sp. Root710 TaxID=1736594 RepID=UPI001F21FA81|nr:low molecular weight protein-tyrosine-phosphatase [Sphingomonas sp. Root710]